WVWYRSRQDGLRVRYERDLPAEDVDELEFLRGELPNGGARVVGAPRRADDVDLGALVADPLDAELPARRRAPPPPAHPEPEAEAESEPDPVVAAEPHPEPEPEPRPVRERPPAAPARSAREPEDEAFEEDVYASLEQTPLFAGEPIVARDTPRRARRKGEPRRARRERPREEERPAAPEEVLVIHVLRRDGARMAGTELLDVVTAQGLQFGDMNIFHRYGSGGRGRIEFSMASAVEPGTFDLGALEEFETPGVVFFMQLPGPEQPLDAFEHMARAARAVARTFDADLKDEQHSVMTAQTLEHCRQRIRDFRRRQMSRPA
ncbi:MAG: cell division protein ZipA, partial [Pseudomonadales bacterium]|nr:cell division protein ZipA [Pseudomonadales bacterium]